MGKKLVPAKNFGAVNSMLAGLLAKALQSGKQAERVYPSSHGPCDADLVDFVFSQVQRFLDSGELTDQQASGLRWNRALILWELGKFAEAIDDTTSALPHYQKSNSRAAVNMQLSLKLMGEGRPPLALLEYSTSFG